MPKIWDILSIFIPSSSIPDYRMMKSGT